VLPLNNIINDGFFVVKNCKTSIIVAKILMMSPLFELTISSISPFGKRSPKARL
jgi:hypothetical protein